MEKIYTCICGKQFNSPGKIGGHKSHCKEYLSSINRLENRINSEKIRAAKDSSKIKANSLNRRKEELDKWLLEKHKCSKCGKIMTEFYGSGIYCSKSCACSHTLSENTKSNISMGLIISATNECGKVNKRLKELEANYYKNPKRCSVCESVIPYRLRHRKTCSDECTSKLKSITASEVYRRHPQENRNDRSRGNAHFGTYKGIRCDSSYELAFLMSCLDNHKSIERNHSGYKYTFNGVVKTFYPDFIVDGELFEIKNYHSDITDAKVSAMPSNIKFHILYKEDMQSYIAYCKSTYGNNFDSLYDMDKPSWINS